ncbi:MAG TPA: hypothetical protein VMU92_06860 [Acidobacteriaceae bacterium]|nr:hypothetical protein [Acidobacteriaceae bacterium]
MTGCLTPVGHYCNGLGYGPKVSDVASITLQPEATGFSLAWGQTAQLGTPIAYTCKGQTASVPRYNYGSSNLLLADVSPSGEICGGTWNRNSPGGIANYTICTPPASSSTDACTSTNCGVVQMTVAAGGVSSNPVPIYVHPPITSISLTAAAQNACYSQNTQGPVLSPFPPPGGGSPTVEVLGPNGYHIPAADVGTITYTATTSSVVNINNTSVTGTGVNGATTANMPGATIINASVSQTSSGSAAGYFYTCPPMSIALSLNGDSTGPISIKKGTPLNIGAVIKDTKGATLNGLTLDYTATQPQEFSVTSLGQVSALWPGYASINAICQSTSCNPAPIGQIGIFGTGEPVVSNTLKVTSPGINSNVLWMASTQSQFFSSIDLTTGTPSSPVRLPYPPNSMVMNQTGTTLYFGSYRELMAYNTVNNQLAKEDPSVPGVVLAVSPDGANLVINDQLRHVIYLYSGAGGITSSIGGLATRAAFSPDSKNAYVVGPDALYVYNEATGWSTYTAGTTPAGPTQPNPSTCNLSNNTPGSGTFDPFCGADLAITVPSIGPFVSGSPTTAWGFCPNTTSASEPVYYPQAASVGVQTDQLAATDDGLHILGADAKDNNLTDISVNIPTGACPTTNTGIALNPTFNQIPLGVTASEIDQVVVDPNSQLAFVTYTSPTAAGVLPYYVPSATAGSPGTMSNIQLSGSAKSPVAGIFSPNDTIFFIGTSGDNLVHLIDASTLQDTKVINPGLVDANGNPVPVQMMAVKPRSTL